MKFKRELLRELDLPWSAKEDEIIGHSRWSVEHKIIFDYNDKFYQTTYSIGATEMQEERSWENEEEVECQEVRQVDKIIKVWEPVNET